jgi:predicted Ser/Thr protein kinase
MNTHLNTEKISAAIENSIDDVRDFDSEIQCQAITYHALCKQIEDCADRSPRSTCRIVFNKTKRHKRYYIAVHPLPENKYVKIYLISDATEDFNHLNFIREVKLQAKASTLRDVPFFVPRIYSYGFVTFNTNNINNARINISVGQHPYMMYIIMDKVAGKTLNTVQRPSSTEYGRIIRMIDETLIENNIWHNDLRNPNNIFIDLDAVNDKKKVSVIDFGEATEHPSSFGGHFLRKSRRGLKKTKRHRRSFRKSAKH